MLQDELMKDTYNKLLSVNPAYILVDFYSDVVNGVLEVNNYSYIVNRAKEWMKNPVFCAMQVDNTLDVFENKEEYLRRWKIGFDKFIKFVNEYLPETEVIINSARGTNKTCDESGKEIIHEFQINVDKVNEVWEEMDEYAAQKHGLRRVVNERAYYMSADYIFSKNFWIVHYEKTYYIDRKEQLLWSYVKI